MPISTECIEHTKAVTNTGYGKLKRAGRMWLAHRWAWTEANGPIPDGMVVIAGAFLSAPKDKETRR